MRPYTVVTIICLISTIVITGCIGTNNSVEFRLPSLTEGPDPIVGTFRVHIGPGTCTEHYGLDHSYQIWCDYALDELKGTWEKKETHYEITIGDQTHLRFYYPIIDAISFYEVGGRVFFMYRV